MCAIIVLWWQLDEPELREVIDPVRIHCLEPREDHRVDRREVRPLSYPDRPHVEAQVVTFAPPVVAARQVLVDECAVSTCEARHEVQQPRHYSDDAGHDACARA